MKDPSSKTNLDLRRFGGGDSGHFLANSLLCAVSSLAASQKDKMQISVIFNAVYMNPWKCN